MTAMSDSLSDDAYIGAIRCECGGTMEVDEAEAAAEGILYTVVCGTCGEKGGYNSATLKVYGALDGLEVIGE